MDDVTRYRWFEFGGFWIIIPLVMIFWKSEFFNVNWLKNIECWYLKIVWLIDGNTRYCWFEFGGFSVIIQLVMIFWKPEFYNVIWLKTIECWYLKIVWLIDVSTRYCWFEFSGFWIIIPLVMIFWKSKKSQLAERQGLRLTSEKFPRRIRFEINSGYKRPQW